MDFGKLGTGALAGSTLTLQAQFVLTTTSLNTDFYANLIVGDPPPAPAPAIGSSTPWPGSGAVRAAR